jgi:hypothetical protein
MNRSISRQGRAASATNQERTAVWLPRHDRKTENIPASCRIGSNGEGVRVRRLKQVRILDQAVKLKGRGAASEAACSRIFSTVAVCGRLVLMTMYTAVSAAGHFRAE